MTYIAYGADRARLRTMGTIAAAIALGFFLIYVNGWRKTGVETCGKAIWWNSLRPVHALLWGLFAYLALTGNRAAYIPLAIDTLVGAVAWAQRQ